MFLLRSYRKSMDGENEDDASADKGSDDSITEEPGPSRVIPVDQYMTTDIFTPVKLREGSAPMAKITPKSVPEILDEAVAATPNRIALAYKKNPKEVGFRHITFVEYKRLTRIVAKGFLKLGLERLHTVAILGFNSPEWFLSYLGAIHAGGVACGIYTTNTAEATFYCLEKGSANIAVVEDESQAQRILQYKSQLPNLKAVIQYNGKLTAPNVLSWIDLINIGRKEDEKAIEKALKKMAINECCTLIFTSGTTGNPKGVMLSHDNLIWDASSITSVLGIEDDEKLISYLPLSHVAALMVDMYIPLLKQMTVYFANKDALKGGLLKTLCEVRPTRLLGVPRIWEKLAEKMKVATEESCLKKRLIKWAMKKGLRRNLDLMKGVDSPTLGYTIAKSLIFSKIKLKLGLDHCKTFWSGAAPLSKEIKTYFASLDILIMEGFGMSECSSVHTLNIISSFRLDATGRTIPGANTKIYNPDEDQQGEVCISGRHVFMGYLTDKAQTDEALDSDGWLHSGDIGKLDKDGFLTITGRIKELLITAGGENIAPVLIENNVKTQLPFLGYAVVICEKKKFLSMLITLGCEIDPETGEPTDNLSEMSKKWLNGLGFSFTKTSQVIQSGPDKKILASIQKGIDAANEKAISHAQRVQKFVILPKDFSVPTGELGPTQKLRRNFINEKYKDVIEKFYVS